MTYLYHDDALLLKALCSAGQAKLFNDFPEWVSFGRQDVGALKGKKPKGITDQIELDYEGWFTKWLRFRKLLSVIASDKRPYVVISDVANFFPSIDLIHLREQFARAAALDNDATGLLFHIVDSLASFHRQGGRAALGLPQDPYDASRILAHFFLRPLDQAFDAEGKAGRYTRWVDDLAVSVEDELEGREVIGRIQDVLAQIGLNPNPGKTSVITKDDFRSEHYEQYNEFLDHVHNQTGQATVLPVLRRIFEQRLRSFLSESPQKRYWYRVLRRFYTESRRIGSRTLRKSVRSHLREFPSEARHIFDYLAYQPSNTQLPVLLFEHLKLEGRLYEDAQILGYEALLSSALPDDPLLRWIVVRNAYFHLRGVGGFVRPSAYVRGLIALALYKFGGKHTLNLLAKDFRTLAEESPVFARYGFLVLYAAATHKDVARDGIRLIDDPTLRQLERFVSAVEAGEDRAIKLTFGLLEPKSSKLPSRLLVPARVLPLLAIGRRSPAKTQVDARIAQVRKKLLSQPEKFRDAILLSHL